MGNNYDRTHTTTWGETTITVTWSGRHAEIDVFPEGIEDYAAEWFCRAGLAGDFTLAFLRTNGHHSTSEKGHVRAIGSDLQIEQGAAVIKILMPGNHHEFRFVASSNAGDGPGADEIVATLKGYESKLLGKEPQEESEKGCRAAEEEEDAEAEAERARALALLNRSGRILLEAVKELMRKDKVALTEGQMKAAVRRVLGEIAGSPSRVTHEDVREALSCLKESGCLLQLVDGKYFPAYDAFGRILDTMTRCSNNGELKECLESVRTFLTSGPYAVLRDRATNVRGGIERRQSESTRLTGEINGIEEQIDALRVRSDRLKAARLGEETAIENNQLVLEECETILDRVRPNDVLILVEDAMTRPSTV